MKRILFASLLVGISGAYAADSLTTSPTTTPEIAVTQDESVGPPKPVEVVNVPDVNVVNPVTVAPSAPQPIYEVGHVNILDGEQASDFVTMFTVPDGKQLVVTQASASIEEPSAVAFRVDVEDFGGFAFVNNIAPTRGGPLVIGGPDAWMMNVTLELHVREGHKVTCSALRHGSAGDAFGRCSIAGYLVDAPQE